MFDQSTKAFDNVIKLLILYISILILYINFKTAILNKNVILPNNYVQITDILFRGSLTDFVKNKKERNILNK